MIEVSIHALAVRHGHHDSGQGIAASAIFFAQAIQQRGQRRDQHLPRPDLEERRPPGVDQRLRRLHELGFEATELELVSTGEGDRLRLVPCVVEHGFHAQRLKALTGLHAEENQARRLLNDMSRFGAVLEQRSGKRLPEAVVAARWLGERFEAAIDAVPEDLAANPASHTGRFLKSILDPARRK